MYQASRSFSLREYTGTGTGARALLPAREKGPPQEASGRFTADRPAAGRDSPLAYHRSPGPNAEHRICGNTASASPRRCPDSVARARVETGRDRMDGSEPSSGMVAKGRVYTRAATTRRDGQGEGLSGGPVAHSIGVLRAGVHPPAGKARALSRLPNRARSLVCRCNSSSGAAAATTTTITTPTTTIPLCSRRYFHGLLQHSLRRVASKHIAHASTAHTFGSGMRSVCIYLHLLAFLAMREEG